MAKTKQPSPEGKPSPSGEYLEASLQALRNACSSDTLYRPLKFKNPSKYSALIDDIMVKDAASQRTAYSRTSLLYSAFAAEAFVNEFIEAHFTGKDFDAIDRMGTVDKYAIAPALALGEEVFDRGSEPLTSIAKLFDLRAGLVHPKPGKIVKPSKAGGSHPTQNPKHAAQYLIAVADAAIALRIEWYGADKASDKLDMWSVVISGSKGYLRERASQATKSLPARNAKHLPGDFMMHLLMRLGEKQKSDEEAKKAS